MTTSMNPDITVTLSFTDWAEVVGSLRADGTGPTSNLAAQIETSVLISARHAFEATI